MCGIVGGISERNIVTTLLEGLKRLEYRGYDSAGIAVINGRGNVTRWRSVGNVSNLTQLVEKKRVAGSAGIAHTRWATHGKKGVTNAHPHMSGSRAIVHNGVIVNHDDLRLSMDGYVFKSETDTEVIIHKLDSLAKAGQDLMPALRALTQEILEGEYSFAILDPKEGIWCASFKMNEPLVIGIGDDGFYVASDEYAFPADVAACVHLLYGDIACIKKDGYLIFDNAGNEASRRVSRRRQEVTFVAPRHVESHMLEEIFFQPEALRRTIGSYLADTGNIKTDVFGEYGSDLEIIAKRIKRVCILACGTSLNAGKIFKQWLQEYIPCNIEIASEFRHSPPKLEEDTLVILISQSGTTSDTLACLDRVKGKGLWTLSICNVRGSALAKKTDFSFTTRAEREFAVASTKAFTAQLAALMGLVLLVGSQKKLFPKEKLARMHQAILSLPERVEEALALSDAIAQLAQEEFHRKQHALFLGRGVHLPVAEEGALKLKEISYIHAEAYPAGELKHGPIALVDKRMPIVAVAARNGVLRNILSNFEEVRARGARLLVFCDETLSLPEKKEIRNIPVPGTKDAGDFISPVIYTIPLQLLAYHAARARRIDVDQPRNLAKSVTVE